MNKICTSIEQSKKLIELGIDIKTADMYYSKYNTIHANTLYGTCDIQDFNIREYIPAWSLSVLLELIPFQIIENNNRFGFYQDKGFNRQGETYHFCYKTNSDFCLYETFWYNDVIDAAFEMVCWLKENGKI